MMMLARQQLPDLDVVSRIRRLSLSYLTWHRSYTHAFALAPAMALIAPLAMLVFFRLKLSWWAYLFSLLGVLSHLLLDWTNVYGIRLLLPFSSRWLRLDQTDIVDPWILAMMLLAMAAPALAGMVGAEIGSKKSRGPKRGWAWFALMAILVYEGGRFTAHERAIAVMNAHLFNGTIATHITALPDRANARCDGGGVDQTDRFRPEIASCSTSNRVHNSILK